MKRSRLHRRGPSGVSWLELQAATAVFGILLSGLAPFTVMYLKQVAVFEKRLNPATTYYLLPSSEPWARKVGAAATITSTAPTVATAHLPMPNAGLRILSFEEPFADEELTVTVSLSTGS